MITLLLWAAPAAAIIWTLYCLDKTGTERQNLLMSQIGMQKHDIEKMQAEFEKVSFARHFWRRFTFRSRRQLYGPNTHHLMGWSWGE